MREQMVIKFPGFSTGHCVMFAYRSAGFCREELRRIKEKPVFIELLWWAHKGSNLGPPRYERGTLTSAPSRFNKIKYCSFSGFIIRRSSPELQSL